jgi:hypothetical protein
VIAPVVASERATAQTLPVKAGGGLKDYVIETRVDLNWVGNQTTEGESPVKEDKRSRGSILSRAGSETPRLNLPAPSGKAKYS